MWTLAQKYLEQGLNKNFVVHTEGVVHAMELLLKKEKGDPDILIPAAILHDTGWAKVPAQYQRTTDKKKKLRGMQLHIALAPAIIKTILHSLKYPAKTIEEIVGIVQAHKFANPRLLSRRLLIDADQLSDAFREQFTTDAKEYGVTPEQMYGFRMRDNRFYTETAKNIFRKEMQERKREIVRENL